MPPTKPTMMSSSVLLLSALALMITTSLTSTNHHTTTTSSSSVVVVVEAAEAAEPEHRQCNSATRDDGDSGDERADDGSTCLASSTSSTTDRNNSHSDDGSNDDDDDGDSESVEESEDDYYYYYDHYENEDGYYYHSDAEYEEITMPFYPTDEFDDIGVRQLYDPTIMTLQEFFDSLNFAVSHIDAFDDPDEDISMRRTAGRCRFKDDRCVIKQHQGLCWNEVSPTNAKDYYDMVTNCCPVCDGIPQLEYFLQCPIDPKVYNPFTEPGQVTQKFVNMLTKLQNLGMKYEVHATPFHGHASDDGKDNDNNDSHVPDYIRPLLIPPSSSGGGAGIIQHGPWIVTIDDFVTHEQADTLIKHGEHETFERSMDGVSNPDGSWSLQYVDFRTSREAYCWLDFCVDDPIVVGLMKNITSTIDIPLPNCYFLQLLKYHVGELYKEHQDYHTHQAMGRPGARVVTWYMYLSDVEAGGETQFPRIDVPVKVKPKKGKVLVWSNIRDDDPNEEDLLARHEALPVISGLKYGATAWFHHRNIREIPEYCHN